ncbi:hypothetical protein PZE06_20965 [Robertmurraya sp. DFI.2.37]|uniref:hypothetical protein n=1 Tax=Robertmurraya sp. DFI.2.37 TaxID=3031819 RepID=UPI0012463546|nr:hypothetical protein [Robertmurraya sp. DFI.2.37]MDF1510609.1 hypothetical protein [Robertmurraya sp. DFI.2.37]
MTVEVGVLIAIGGLLLSYFGYQLNRTKEVKTDSRQDAKIQAQLDYIGKGVDDIRIELRANQKDIGALNERVTRVEESAKQAHLRINNINKESV